MSQIPLPSVPRHQGLGGIYIHWPFCVRKCPYCDFYTFGNEHPVANKTNEYLEALLADISHARETFSLESPPAIDTIYFGGGTPSLISADGLRKIIAALGDQFEVAEGTEITLEVNPTAAEGERLAEYRALGVNRLSIGCQSFDDRFLETLGRDHDAATARSVLRLARQTGFDNISLDLMFGLPGQSMNDVASDIDHALEFAPEHFSAYGLTLHEETPFGRWAREGKLIKAESDLEAEMFELMMDRLDSAGYEQYEISNWAKFGHESRHNGKYWQQADVYAFGPSAHGVLGGRRFATARDLGSYLHPGRAGAPGDDENEFVDKPGPDIVWQEAAQEPRARAAEVMMLALRRTDLIAWNELDTWADADIRNFYEMEFEQLRLEKLIDTSPKGFKLTRRGILLADEVTRRFF